MGRLLSQRSSDFTTFCLLRQFSSSLKAPTRIRDLYWRVLTLRAEKFTALVPHVRYWWEERMMAFKTSVLETNGLPCGLFFTFVNKQETNNGRKTKWKKNDFSNVAFPCNKEHLWAREDGGRWSMRCWWPFLVWASEGKILESILEGIFFFFGANQTKSKQEKGATAVSHESNLNGIYCVISHIITDSVWGWDGVEVGRREERGVSNEKLFSFYNRQKWFRKMTK